MKIIGKPRRRVDGRAKVTGQTKFADDVLLPRMLHGKLLRSTLPHARIVRIDVSRAVAHPEESLAYDSPRIHDYGDSGNIHKIVSLGFGDVDQAFAAADHVFED